MVNSPEYQRAYRAKHIEKFRAYWRKWYYLRKERIGSRAMNEYRAKFARLSPSVAKERQQKYAQKLREQVLTFYGNSKMACVKCGFTDIRALTIDHINGKGNEHRKQSHNHGGTSFYIWLRKSNYPEGYQTLCMNCQFIKRKENNEFYNMRWPRIK